LIIGLGAVTVIEFHGFKARHSAYWTEATIRTHKITKPLIWLGLGIAIIGGILLFNNQPLTGAPLYLTVDAVIMIMNGCFLSFVVSPGLLRQEAQGRAKDLLPKRLQEKITLSFFVSIIGWWSGVAAISWWLANQLA
jgi:hypothetical protein